MTVIIILTCIALFIALVLSLRLRITVEYKSKLTVYLHVGPVKLTLFSTDKQRKKRGARFMSKARAKRIRDKARQKALKKKQKRLAKKRAKKKAEGEEKKKLSFRELLDIISSIKDIVSTALGKFFKYLRVDLARFHINVATGDAATTALAYGAVCDALTHLFVILEPLRGFELPDNRDISVEADYLSEKTTADIKLSFSLRVWHILIIALATFIKLTKHMVKFKSRSEDLPHGHKNKAANAVHIKKGN